MLLYLTVHCIAGSWNILLILTGFPAVLLGSIVKVLYGRTFKVCCDAVHKVLSTITDYVCENIPDEFEPVYLSTKSQRMKRKRTGKYYYKLTRYYQLKFTEGRNRRG